MIKLPNKISISFLNLISISLQKILKAEYHSTLASQDLFKNNLNQIYEDEN